MRFEPKGPEIPQELLLSWRRGNSIFLAGAGVSISASLPTFAGLSIDVCESIDPQLAPILKLTDPTEEEITAASASAMLAANATVEAQLFHELDLDRVFSAWERRFGVEQERVRHAVAKRLRKHKGAKQEHRDLLRLSLAESTTHGEICRIATTNFDRLFEAAWKQEFGTRAVESDARSCARPGAFDFEGVVHVHGKLPPSGNKGLSSLILTSNDFARGYLRGGVVANLIHDMSRRFDIVLVGYSANDPVMRYLLDAIAEDKFLFGDMHKVYALVEAGDNPHATELNWARWNLKNIEPVFYENPKGDHSALWSTVSSWAQWKRLGPAWVDARLAEIALTPFAEASAFQLDFVRDLFKLLDEHSASDAGSKFASAGADFGWFDVVFDTVPVPKRSDE